MATKNEYTNIILKRLLDWDHLGAYLFDYMMDELRAAFARVYDKDGTFGSTKVTIAASGNDEFDLSSQQGTDGRGWFLESGLLYSSVDYEQNVPFENTNTVIYDIGLRRALVPIGVHNGSRSGVPEYKRWQERIGKVGTPDSIGTGLSSNVYLNLPASICDNDRTHAGRKVLAWKVDPLSSEEAVAIQLLTVEFTGSVNRVLSNDFFGGDSKDSTAANYRVCLLGPRVTRQSETPLQSESNTWYVGQIVGAGAGNPPTSPSVANQRLIEYSLSDWIAQVDTNKALSEGNFGVRQAASIGNWFLGAEAASGGDYSANDAAGGRTGSATTAGGTYWVVVGDDDGSDALLFYSNRGREWTEKANPKAYDLNGVVYDPSNDIWISVGDADGADAYIITCPSSPNQTWTERANAKNVSLNKIATDGSGTSIAVGANDGSDVYALKTTNGTSFSELSLGGSGDVGNDIAYGEPGGVPTWVVCGRNGSTPKVWYSIDGGSSWSSATVPGSFADPCKTIAWNGRKFVVGGDSGDMMNSADGQTWAFIHDQWGDLNNVEGDTLNHVFLGSTGAQFFASLDDGDTWQRLPHYPHRAGDETNAPARVAHDGYAWLGYEVDFTDDKLWTAFSGNTNF